MSLYGETEAGKRCRKNKKTMVPGVAEASKRILGRDESVEELLPGIPDQIALGLILPKLSWKTCHILAAVSPRWLRAIRSHEVYDGRVYSHSTETFVVLVSYTRECALYSMKHKSFTEIPPIPDLDRRPTLARQCVAVNGRLYVFKLGGEITKRNCNDVVVYVLDLAGQRRQWQYCGIMQQPRHGFGYAEGFGYAAPDGKFYVFKHGSASEVYDPESRTWSLRKPMPSLRYDHKVAKLGEELLVYGGWSNGKESHAESLEVYAESLEVYNPLKDEWRVVGYFRNHKPVLFTAHGKIHAMSGEYIYVHEREAEWRKMQRCLYVGIVGVVYPIVVGVVDDELLARITRYKRDSGVSFLVRSKGFRRGKVIVWERVTVFGPLAELHPSKTSLMVPIQL